MKKGYFISESDLIQKGFYQIEWLAGYKVFKKFNQESEDYTYIIWDFWGKTIVNTFMSKQ